MANKPVVPPEKVDEALEEIGAEVVSADPPEDAVAQFGKVPRTPSRFDDDLRDSEKLWKSGAASAWKAVDVVNDRSVETDDGPMPLPDATEAEIRRAGRSLKHAKMITGSVSVVQRPSPVDPENKTRVSFTVREPIKRPRKKKNA